MLLNLKQAYSEHRAKGSILNLKVNCKCKAKKSGDDGMAFDSPVRKVFQHYLDKG